MDSDNLIESNEELEEKLNDFEKKLDEGIYITFNDIRKYVGIFTGKNIKLDQENKNLGHFEEFKKGDKVLVLNLEDYFKFYSGFEALIVNKEK